MTERKKILIVEDETLIFMFIQMQLKKQGFMVCHNAPDCKKALDVFHNENPDLILMDIRIGNGPDGIETSQIIKKEKSDIPIIFMTGYDEDEVRAKALATNPIAFIIKPIDVEQVTKIIDKHFTQG